MSKLLKLLIENNKLKNKIKNKSRNHINRPCRYNHSTSNPCRGKHNDFKRRQRIINKNSRSKK